MAKRPADAPALHVRRHLPEDEEVRIVAPEHRVEAQHEDFFDVPEMTEDFLRGPARWSRPPREGRVVVTGEERHELIGRTRHALETLHERPPQIVVGAWHGASSRSH